MSKHLFNFCVCHDYVEQLEQTGKNLPEYVNSLGLDGIEHLVYTKEPPSPTFRESSTGAHLAYWPYWLGFWKNNKARLKREFKSAKARNDCYLGAMNKDEWLSVIQQNLIAAEAVKPEYMVWHVSEADVQETYTFDFQYSDRDDMVKFFFERIQRKNVGIMLDTGHLMNTNPELRDEEEAADYVCRTVDNLGELAELIRGVHLSCSLSGGYQKSFVREYPKNVTFGEMYKHIVQIDQHQPFRTKAARRILEFVQPHYITHEMIYSTLTELEEKLEIQLSNC